MLFKDFGNLPCLDITDIPPEGCKFAFLAGGNEFQDEKCMYGNVSFRAQKLMRTDSEMSN